MLIKEIDSAASWRGSANLVGIGEVDQGVKHETIGAECVSKGVELFALRASSNVQSGGETKIAPNAEDSEPSMEANMLGQLLYLLSTKFLVASPGAYRTVRTE